MTQGMRDGEMVLVCAGSGVGKSEVVRQVAFHLVKSLDEPVGYVALEESLQRTCLGFIGLHMGRKVHLEMESITDDELLEAKRSVFDTGRFYLYDHFGSNDVEALLSRIRFMVVGSGVRTVVLDHISIVVSGTETDERKTIDIFVTKLKTLAMELKFRLICIIHLKRTDGKTFEEGAAISLNDIRGSGAPGQLANIVIGLERDQQDPDKCNYTRMRVVKNRHSGVTGVAGWLLYGADGRLVEVAEPEQQKQVAESFDAADQDAPFV
jgi:twinkle protein